MGKDSPSDVRSPRASVDAVLAFAWEANTFMVTDAMLATDLTRSTAINAIDALIDSGLLTELPNARAAGQYAKGRPARRFELRSDAAVVVGIDAGRVHLTIVVADLRGTELARHVVTLDGAQDTTQGRKAAILNSLDAAVEKASRGADDVLSVCVGVPAPVDADGRSPSQRQGFWQRMNPHLTDLLAERIPIVLVENDAYLAAVAEGSVGQAVGLRDFVVVLAGDRLGAGVVIDGHLLRGHHGGVGELSAFDHVRGIGSADGLGLRLGRWARHEVTTSSIPTGIATGLPEPLTARIVLELARSGDIWARRLVGRGGALLARITTVLGSLYGSSRVIVAGAVADDLDAVLESAHEHLERDGDALTPELVRSRLGADAVVTGAVSAARDAARRGVLHLDPAAAKRLRRAPTVPSPMT